jgi:hypothetical protein
MKKARVLSTICTSLALAAPALAQIPPAGSCFVRAYDAAHLARNPQQGVAAIRLRFHAPPPGSSEAAAIVIVRMADQGQGRADGVGGQTLRQIAWCRDAGKPSCFVECDGGMIALSALADGGLQLATEHFLVGADLGCGEDTTYSNLSEGGRTVYRLVAAPAEACADLTLD